MSYIFLMNFIGFIKSEPFKVFVQSLITAILLLVQSLLFPGCISNSGAGDVNQSNDVNIVLPENSLPFTLPVSD